MHLKNLEEEEENKNMEWNGSCDYYIENFRSD